MVDECVQVFRLAGVKFPKKQNKKWIGVDDPSVNIRRGRAPIPGPVASAAAGGSGHPGAGGGGLPGGCPGGDGPGGGGLGGWGLGGGVLGGRCRGID